MKLFKSPERIYAFSMWIVTLVFASFLLGLGGKIIADIPSATAEIQIEQYMPAETLAQINRDARNIETEREALVASSEKAAKTARSANNDYTNAQSAHRNWLSTRSVTANNPQSLAGDKELEERTRGLDKLAAASRAAQSIAEKLDMDRSLLDEKLRANEELRSQLVASATPAYNSELRWRELKVFGLRLLITLPLLVAAGWMIRKKRKSQYWPLARGFVIFAGVTFFFELVPYLPSYGGYIRYLVGIFLCLAGGHYGIRAMQRYLARRQAEEKQNEQERRSNLDRDMALSKMESGLCPGCDRKIPAGVDGQKVNHCVHCGLTLFSFCPKPTCGVRNNAFYHYCPVCGTNEEKDKAVLAASATNEPIEGQAFPSVIPTQ